MIIAIDGPAASGKSTVGRLVAKRLGYLYLDTGAMYRALTLKAIERGVDLKNERALIDLARKTQIDLKVGRGGELKVFLGQRDVTHEIRAPGITNEVSYIAKVGGVRERMVNLQREIGQKKNIVVEGRDIGTVVFPKADKKFYLDAHFKERARRRYKELCQSGRSVRLENVEEELCIRDEKDRTREVGPLKKAFDAIHLDTTHLTIEEVVDRICSNLG